MKHKFISLAMTVIALLLLGCKNDNPVTANNNNNDSISNLRQEYKDSPAARDSLINGLVLQVDTLTKTLNETKGNIVSLQSAENKKTSKFRDVLYLIPGILALVGLFVVGWLTRHDVEKDDVKDIIDNQLKKKGLSDLKIRVQDLENRRVPQSSVGNSGNDKVTCLERRIAELERKLSDSQQPRTLTAAPAVHAERKEIPSQRLYANMNSNEYFMSVVETKQETCVFVLELSSPTSGEFDIISIEKIKQRNGWKDIVEVDCIGDCLVSEATTSKTISKGKCEKLSDGSWKIVKNLKIKLSK